MRIKMENVLDESKCAPSESYPAAVAKCVRAQWWTQQLIRGHSLLQKVVLSQLDGKSTKQSSAQQYAIAVPPETCSVIHLSASTTYSLCNLFAPISVSISALQQICVWCLWYGA